VALGGLHVTSLPRRRPRTPTRSSSAPGEDIWPQFLADFRKGRPGRVYQSRTRTLAGLPPIRRDLIKRRLYLVPNSIVVSRGCPHVCDFCYKEAFFEGGKSFYTQTVDDALAEIERLPGRHLYFLDDHLFGDRRFAGALFDGMRGMGACGRPPAPSTPCSRRACSRKAVDAGLRQPLRRLRDAQPRQSGRDAQVPEHEARLLRRVRRLHDLGVMINGSFVFGMDGDDASVFDRTVEWAVGQGIETADVPHPHAVSGHRALHAHGQGRAAHRDQLGPVRHAAHGVPPRAHDWPAARGRLLARVPAVLHVAQHRARRRGARQRRAGLRHFAYASGWKKFEPLWDVVIRAKQAGAMLPCSKAS
jgi:hypothetical protein